MVVRWKGIHPDLTLELQKEWERLGFGYSQTKEWLNIVEPNDYEFAHWIKKEYYGYKPCDYASIKETIDFLRSEYIRDTIGESETINNTNYIEELDKEREHLNAQLNNNYQTNERNNNNNTNMTEKRTILLLGRTGNGKSTLANVISDSNDFRESSSAISETKDANIRQYLIDGIEYKIIDTIGIGDTKLTAQQVLYKIAEASHAIKDGLNQILFVNGGRFTKEEIEAYDLLRSVIFDNEVVKYTTIVRTNFPEFEDIKECETDKEQMVKENERLADVVENCRKVMHVDNPPLKGRNAETNKEIREESRKRLLLHLNICKEAYRPTNLDELNKRIGNYMSEKEILQKQLKEARNLSNKEREQAQKRMAELEKKIAQQTQQHVGQRNPHFFGKVGDVLDSAIEIISKPPCRIS